MKIIFEIDIRRYEPNFINDIKFVLVVLNLKILQNIYAANH